MRYRALYSFKKTHPSSVGFEESEDFIELPGASEDKNWYYAISSQGKAGYIPRNYVEKKETTLEEFKKLAEDIKERVKTLNDVGNREKGELLAKIDRTRINFERTLPVPPAYKVDVEKILYPGKENASSTPSTGVSATQAASGSESSRSSTPPKAALKKRAAPRPPAINSVKSEGSSREASPVSSSKSSVVSNAMPDDVDSITTVVEHNKKQQMQKQMSRQGSIPGRPSIPDPSEDQIRNHACELIELVRNQSGLSYNSAQDTIHSVLTYISTNFTRLDRNVPGLLCALEIREEKLLHEPKDIAKSQDYKVLERLFEELTKCKEDDQQRNWMLEEDDQKIHDFLNQVCDRLQNAPRNASIQVLQRFKYFYVNNMIEYFQMETRRQLRRLLIEAFLLMCSLDANIILLMLSSVLPLELVQDIYQTKDSNDALQPIHEKISNKQKKANRKQSIIKSKQDIERLRSDGLLLTVILSTGEPMPVHYQDQMGSTFVDYLLDYIEEPPSREFEVEVCDCFIGVLLAFNLQFKDANSNVLVDTLSRRVSVKTFMEKILLLLNREEDPTTIIEGEYTGIGAEIEDRPENVHATQKVILDIFKHKTCHKLFYTNDLYVLIDIIVRALSDLSYEDPRRSTYVDMCELVLRHSNYDEHLHRFKDLEHCFLRILEEEESRDRKRIQDLCKEISAFSSLTL